MAVELWRYACPFCHSRNLRKKQSGGHYCETGKHIVPPGEAIDLRYEELPEKTLEYDRSAAAEAAVEA